MYFIYFLLWFPMLLIAILNGTARTLVYSKYLTDLLAHQISTLTALIFFSIYIWIVTGLWKLESGNQALLIGLMWVLMTVAFEFLFGHYIANNSWSKLLQDYNIFKGRLWMLILIWIFIAPYLCFKLRGE